MTYKEVFLPGKVKDQDGPVRVLVVDPGHVPEPLVARHVPQLEVQSPVQQSHLGMYQRM